MITWNPTATQSAPSNGDISSHICCKSGVVEEALSILRHGRPNMLVVGDADMFLEQIRPSLVPPVACWTPNDTATRPTTPFRTLIVRDVDDLRLSQDLLTDLNTDVQIISTTKAPLFPAVQRGAFPDGLYYRLNVVMLTLPAAAEQDGF
jgi:hypothetical protein